MKSEIGSSAILAPSAILFKLFLDYTLFHEGVLKMEYAFKPTLYFPVILFLSDSNTLPN